MSWKSILLSILTIVVSAALLFGVVYLFAISIILGIVGVIVWGIINVTLRNKALSEAGGVFDRLLAKYIVPILGTLIAGGLILFLILPGAWDGSLWLPNN